MFPAESSDCSSHVLVGAVSLSCCRIRKKASSSFALCAISPRLNRRSAFISGVVSGIESKTFLASFARPALRKTYRLRPWSPRQLPQVAVDLARFPTKRHSEVQIAKYGQRLLRVPRRLVCPSYLTPTPRAHRPPTFLQQLNRVRPAPIRDQRVGVNHVHVTNQQ